jgi:IMP dehydrogenase
MPYALSFDDVLLLPRESNVPSRAIPSVATKFTRNIDIANPIISTNMATVTEAAMMVSMWRNGSFGILHRFMDSAKYIAQMDEFVFIADKFGDSVPIESVISVGIKGEEIDNGWLDHHSVRAVVVDVAHGDSKAVADTMKRIKAEYPHIDVVGGNIATRDGFMRMVDAGADGIRVGIGGGCFTPDCLVKTECGLKPIQDICVNDMVYTHLGELQKVIELFIYEKDEELCVINDIECTENHEFYVLHKNSQDLVNESNIHQYAEWVSASDLNEDYFLIELE